MDGDVNIDTSGDLDVGDLLGGLLGGVEVDDTLVDVHLIGVPGVGTVTARGLTGGVLEGLGGHADGALDLDVELLSAGHEVGGGLLDGLGVAGGEGDADAGDVGGLILSGLLDGSHFS